MVAWFVARSGLFGASDQRRQPDACYSGWSRPAIAALLLLLCLSGLPAPVTAAPDPRLFPATGFRVSTDQFWDYFQKRGGTRTFGYPVSREFTLLGSKVQIFQRQAMQLRPDGSVGLLNLLDRDLMPYTKINGATLPPFDAAVTSAAPAPGSSNYGSDIITFIKERAPNTWQGLPVNFWVTFNSTVGLVEAFPNGGGDPNVLPALALEIWGVPTSQPAFDPNNRNFVYLRFQRGVMQYDATTGLTQGVLLADYLKGVLTGSGLPADLDKDAKGSPFYGQYSRTAYRGLNKVDALPGSDLTNAFEYVEPPSATGSPSGATGGTAGGTTGSDNRPAPSTPIPTNPTPTDGPVTVSNDTLNVAFQIGGNDHGRLTIKTAEGTARVWSVPVVSLVNGSAINLSKDTTPNGAVTRVAVVSDPNLGEGRQLDIDLGLKGGQGRVRLLATIFEGKTYFLYQLGVKGLAADRAATAFRLFDGEGAGWIGLGAGASYLTEDLELRRESLDARRETEVQAGKPLLLHEGRNGRAFVLATLDGGDHVAKFATRGASDSSGLRLTFETIMPGSGTDLMSPRLFVDVTSSGDPTDVLANYRRVVNTLYPTPRLPDWVRYQWSSWHTFGTEIDEQSIRRQIDYLADEYADLGSWHIVIENGWYRADGRSDADGRRVDTTRFPSGLRSLVDYAHGRGIKVVLGVPGPYINDKVRRGNLIGLRGLVERNRDWLIPIGDSFLYNMQAPGFRAWWTDLVREVLVAYDADGIRIDGLGEAVAAVRKESPRPSLQSAEFYRFTAEQAWAAKPNAYIETGWYVPTFANAYVHTVRFGDEEPVLDRAYPKAGLRQHIDYGLYQRTALNQRPHLGDVSIAALRSDIGPRWVEAALALGGSVAVSADLGAIDDRIASELRQRLVHGGAMLGRTSFTGGPNAETIVTAVDGFTYLGIVNRSATRRNMTVRLADVGLAGRSALVRDVQSARSFVTDELIEAEMAAGAFRLYVIRTDPGWIWTNSSVRTESTATGLRYTLRGPSDLTGFIEIAVPRPTRVMLDGATLGSGNYTYDSSTGILRIEYSHDRSRDLRVEWTSGEPLFRGRVGR